jgi:hypothetical protein
VGRGKLGGEEIYFFAYSRMSQTFFSFKVQSHPVEDFEQRE